MQGKVSIRPAQAVSKGSLIGIAFMIMFGIGFTVLVGGVLRENEAPPAMSVVFYLFMAGWLATALYLLIYHKKNLSRPEGVALFEAEGTPEPNDGAAQAGFARRLRDLEQLRKDGLISQEEYIRKRTEIVDEKW